MSPGRPPSSTPPRPPLRCSSKGPEPSPHSPPNPRPYQTRPVVRGRKHQTPDIYISVCVYVCVYVYVYVYVYEGFGSSLGTFTALALLEPQWVYSHGFFKWAQPHLA